MKRWLREPLLHFLVIGAALFALYGWVADPESVSDQRIVISEADIDRISALFERRWRRAPSQRELDGLVEGQIREEILYREALAMGLDEDDTIVRRRMAQKMEFMFEDLAVGSTPSEETLQAFLSRHPDRFMKPARTSFAHVYLNAENRGPNVESDALRVLATLEAAPDAQDPAAMGDPFMLGYRFGEQTDDQIARQFGADFATALASSKVGTWDGPIASAYGFHLVYVEGRNESRLPPLSEIQDAVEREFVADQREEAGRNFYQSLRSRYEVIVERARPKPEKLARSEPAE